MKALIDGDICVYRVACSCETIPTLAELAAMDKTPDDREDLIEVLPESIMKARMYKLISDILEEVGANEYIIYLSGSENFRNKVNPEYKANRKDLRKPAHYNAAREFLVTEWGAVVTDGIEADDAMGIEQMNWVKSYYGHMEGRSIPPHSKYETIICTIDKDLDTIPGPHYNFVKKIQYDVSEDDAVRFFWKQMLMGDKSDNIYGIKGIGPKKADKLIDVLNTEEEMRKLVYELYDDEDRFNMNLTCLTILQEELIG